MWFYHHKRRFWMRWPDPIGCEDLAGTVEKHKNVRILSIEEGRHEKQLYFTRVTNPCNWKKWKIPVPGPDEVLLQVMACGADITDWKILDGFAYIPKTANCNLATRTAGIVAKGRQPSYGLQGPATALLPTTISTAANAHIAVPAGSSSA